MFTRIFKPKGSTQPWLGPAQPHVHTLTLAHVYDAFDADALWDDQYSGKKGIENIEGDSSQKWKRLRNALDDHRVSVPENDETGRLLGKSFVYTDVVVWISKQVWLEDVAAGAARVKMLAHNLARNHKRDFESSLYVGRAPSYVVMPSDHLDFTQVCFQFGRSVFVPSHSDKLISKLKFELAVKNHDMSGKKPIRSWLFFLKDNRRAERYIGLYEGQNSLLVSLDSLLARDIQSPFQFKENDGYLLINQLENKWECFLLEDNTLTQLVAKEKDGTSVYMCPKGKVLLDGQPVQFSLTLGIRDATDSDLAKYDEKSYHAVDTRQRVAGHGRVTDNPRPFQRPVEEERQASPKPAAEARPAADNGGANPVQGEQKNEETYAEFGVTIIPGRNSSKSVSTYSLVAEGVALPRIDGEFTIPGLRSWMVWLDTEGNPINNPKIDPQKDESVTTFAANSQSSQLFYRPAGEREFKPLQLPLTVQFKNSSIEVVESIFDEWLAILQLANPFAYSLETDNRYLIGRYNPDPSATQADIQLDQLTHPNSLRWDAGGNSKATFTNLGLSRQHAWVEVREDGLHVDLASGYKVYYADKDLKEGNCHEKGDTSALVLKNGDRILVGNYLLRFDTVSA